jgi:hypothetical protein
MRTLPGTRTLELWSTLLRLTGMDPLPRPSGGAAALSATPARHRAPAPQPDGRAVFRAPHPADAAEPGSPSTEAGEAHRELRARLVQEYARRLDVVRAVLAPLGDAWAAEAVSRAERLSAGLAAWERHLQASTGAAAAEPTPDLQVLGAGVLDLLARASTHLSWSDPGAPPPDADAADAGPG